MRFETLQKLFEIHLEKYKNTRNWSFFYLLIFLVLQKTLILLKTLYRIKFYQASPSLFLLLLKTFFKVYERF